MSLGEHINVHVARLFIKPETPRVCGPFVSTDQKQPQLKIYHITQLHINKSHQETRGIQRMENKLRCNTWMPEIPPQAFRKSPSSSNFKSIVEGEWSVVIMSISPACMHLSPRQDWAFREQTNYSWVAIQGKRFLEKILQHWYIESSCGAFKWMVN